MIVSLVVMAAVGVGRAGRVSGVGGVSGGVAGAVGSDKDDGPMMAVTTTVAIW